MTFSDLLAAAQHDPAAADYLALRMAYAASEDYAPYSHDQEHLDLLRAALPAGDLSGAVDAIRGLLDYNYLDIEAHMAADYVYTQAQEPEKSSYHRTFAKGLIDAIMRSGDGRSFESAFVVISIPEEYLILRLMGFQSQGQRLIQQEGHWFDVLTAQHPQSEGTFDIHFNIDLPKNWLGQNIGGDLGE